ncbi:MAG: GHKL domain-containing protein [Clostridiales bacterium]|nr:GHKL domain-containing protein [Clostridiales bacterium]
MIYSIAEIMATAMDTFFLLWYIPNFLNTKFYRKGNLKFWILPIVLLLFELSADRLFPGFDLIAVFLHIGLVLLYSLLISERKIFRAIIATTSYILAIMFVGSIVYMLISFIVGDKAQAFQGTDSPARIIYLVICKLIEYAIYKIILCFFHKGETIERKNNLFFLAYMIMVFFGLGALMVVSLDDPEGELTLQIMIIMGVLTVSVFTVFIFIHKLLEAQKREYEYEFIEEKIESDKKILEESNRVWENLNEVRHDLKNHLTIIKGKLHEGDLISCEKYIEGIYPQIDDIGRLVHTGNSVVDYLINSKFSQNSDIKVKISGNAEIIGSVSDTDIVGLIGNILDNALEAVGKISDDREKQIELYFLRKNNNRIVLCKNTVDRPVLENNTQLVTTKKGIGHGYGNRIIKSIAQKYGGFVEYSEQKGLFCVQVILPS